MTRNLRRLEATEADILKTITDYLEILQAQGKLIYIRHSPSNVILSWNLIKEILHDLYNRFIGEGTAFQKIKSSCFRKLPESQLGAVDLIVFRRKRIEVTKFYYVDATDVILIEVKSPTGKVSPAQDRWAELAVAQGCKYITARSLEDVRKEFK